jgi:hypothetical protein
MTESRPDRESEFDRVVYEFYHAIENGGSVDPQQFIDSDPEFRKELKSSV